MCKYADQAIHILGVWSHLPVHSVLFMQGDKCSGVVLCQAPEQTDVKPSLPGTKPGHQHMHRCINCCSMEWNSVGQNGMKLTWPAHSELVEGVGSGPPQAGTLLHGAGGRGRLGVLSGMPHL